MTLKAQCVDGTITDVKVSDCPVRISKDLMILANVPMSKLIYDCSLKRCEDKYVEYSYVFDENLKLLGYLFYKSKWVVYSTKDKDFVELKDEYSFTPNHNLKLIGRLQEMADPIMFTVKGVTYSIRTIIGRYCGKFMLYVNGNVEYIDIASESEVTIQ